MIKRGILLVSTVAFLAAMLGGCGADQAPQVVKLAMGYVPNIQFAPFYVAVDKGFFTDEGIEIAFDYGWETDLLKLVGTDDLQFAIASGDQVILARSQGLPVVYVLNWYRRFPVCIVSLAESGIRSPADLVGKRVGTPVPYGASYIGLRALLDVTGLEETDMEVAFVGYNQVGAISEGQVDAGVCYAMNEPVQMQAGGEALEIIEVADYANLVSNGLITNDKSVAERTELVQGMVRAAMRGLTYTLEHPDEAYAITVKFVPDAADNEAVNRAILAKSVEFWTAPTGQLGRSAEEEWRASQAVMQAMGLVGTQSAVEEMFTNRFVDEVKP